MFLLNQFIPKMMALPTPRSAWMNTELMNFESNGDTVVISINGLRFLPENVTATKVAAKIFNRASHSWEQNSLISSFSEPDDQVFFPSFKKSLKRKLQTFNDKSCIMVIKVYTIELLTGVVKLLGTATLPVFRDSSGSVINAKDDNNAMPNVGYFQIPIYNQVLKAADLKNLKLRVSDRIPCTTILVSILMNEDLDPFPEYNSGKYHTLQEHMPTDSELLQYPVLLKERKQFTVRDRLVLLRELSKIPARSNDSLSAFIKRKFSLEPDYSPGLFNLTFVVKYDPTFGFRFSVDQAMGIMTKDFPIALVSFSDNMFEYGSEPNMARVDDYVCFRQLDYDSNLRTPQWNDGFHWYRNRPFSQNLFLIIQIFGISFENNDMELEGWAILSVFHTQKFVQHGRFQLPLFGGKPSPEVIDYWTNKYEDLEDALANEVVTLAPKYPSIVIRLCDGRRYNELDGFSLLNKDNLGVNPDQFQSRSSWKKYRSIIPKSASEHDFELRIKENFVDTTGLGFIY
jgi:hypothetical protein